MTLQENMLRVKHTENKVWVQKGEGPWWPHQWASAARVTVGAFLHTKCELRNEPETKKVWAYLSRQMSDYKLMLYSVEWQAIRMSMKGDWADLDGAKSNGRIIMQYVETGNTNNISRVWRCLNLLNAVRMGFNGAADLVGSQQDIIITKLRDRCSGRFDVLKKHKHVAEMPSPDVIRKEWDALHESVQDDILRDLFMRAEKSDRATRPELWWFLDLIHSFDEEVDLAATQGAASD